MPHRLPSATDSAAALRAHAAMVAELRRPGACGGWPEAAGLLETHISTLLLAGGLVYKLKKPVALPFVDFSSLGLRHEACLQELRLNRRTAPRWYQAVVPVVQGDTGAVIAATAEPQAGAAAGALPGAAAGPVIDWAVRMRRFDDQGLFDRLADLGQLDAHKVDRLANVVAHFHARQTPAPPGYGRADATRHWARENAAELAALVAGTDLAPTVATLQRFTETRGAALAGLMDLRCRTGHVREVHGDLHLGNIVWADHTAVLFDALEFSDTLRHIDTIGDNAFTFMDLLAHGLPRLAWRFIGAVLEASGDRAALPLLAWWASYRAAVRAKVALLSVPAGADAGAGAAATGPRAAALARAQRYLAVATALAAPPPPRLVLTFGLSGSGKSVVAGQLAERLGGVRVRSDVERKRLFALPPTARAMPGLYSPDTTRRTYERLAELAGGALAAGIPVVVDAASLNRAERDAMRAVAAAQGAHFTLLVCDAPPAVLLARVLARQAAGGDASDATPEVLAQQQGWAEWPGADEAGDTLRLCTDVPLATLTEQIEALPI